MLALEAAQSSTGSRGTDLNCTGHEGQKGGRCSHTVWDVTMQPEAPLPGGEGQEPQAQIRQLCGSRARHSCALSGVITPQRPPGQQQPRPRPLRTRGRPHTKGPYSRPSPI